MKLEASQTNVRSRDAGQAVIVPSANSVSRVVTEDLVFFFPDGIPAFEDSKRFVLLNDDDIAPFVYLKSLDVEHLGFVCLDPFLVCSRYSVKLSGHDVVQLQLKRPGQAFVICLVTVAKDPTDTTANLMAPVVVNVANCRARQVIQEGYPVRFRVWEAVTRQEEAFRSLTNVDSDTEVG